MGGSRSTKRKSTCPTTIPSHVQPRPTTGIELGERLSALLPFCRWLFKYDKYLNFWEEADENGRGVFIPRDFVVVDNCSVQWNYSEYRECRTNFHWYIHWILTQLKIGNCCLKLKGILSQEEYLQHLHVSAITQALKEIWYFNQTL